MRNEGVGGTEGLGFRKERLRINLIQDQAVNLT